MIKIHTHTFNVHTHTRRQRSGLDEEIFSNKKLLYLCVSCKRVYCGSTFKKLTFPTMLLSFIHYTSAADNLVFIYVELKDSQIVRYNLAFSGIIRQNLVEKWLNSDRHGPNTRNSQNNLIC